MAQKRERQRGEGEAQVERGTASCLDLFQSKVVLQAERAEERMRNECGSLAERDYSKQKPER